VLLRPDRFVAAAGSAGSAVDQMAIFCQTFLPSLGTRSVHEAPAALAQEAEALSV